MPKRFTLGEAQALIPRVKPLLAGAIEQKRMYAEAERSLRLAAQRVTMTGGMLLDRRATAADRNRMSSAAQALQVAIERIDAMGAQIKDLDIGLIDFPSVYRGEDVCLCWKLGESEILYWHHASEGFGGRKAIDADFFSNHGAG
jgi:hypothetical protein